MITNHPARYRDTKTGLPYYNAYAYKEIQRLVKGDFKWSKLLGTWVGNGSEAAKGVPDRFLRPETEEERKERLERKEQEKKLAEEEKKKAEEAAKATKIKEEAPTPASALETNQTTAPATALAPGSAFVPPNVPPPVPTGVPAIMPSVDDKLGASTPVAPESLSSTTLATPSAPGTNGGSGQQAGQKDPPAPPSQA